MKPILIMSSERSGSNLVRRMLGAHPDVAAPPPPHLWRVLQPLLPYYGPLGEERGWRLLLDDALAMTKVPASHLKWKYELDVAEVTPWIRRRNLSGLLGALHDAYAAREKKQFWACKENNLFDHAFRILDVYGEAKVIYLVRDGRDVACSIKKVPTHDQHAYFIAKEWREEQLKCISVWQDTQDGGRGRLLRYEELIADPEREVRALCEFLGLSFDPHMLEFHEDRESKEDAQKTGFWKNLDKPVMQDNSAKFLRELQPGEIEVFESVAGDLLELLGYPRMSPARGAQIRGLRKLVFKLQNSRQKRAKRKALYDEPGRKERDEVMRTINGSRKRDPRAPLAPRLSYKGQA
jgi:hypothetical protein